MISIHMTTTSGRSKDQCDSPSTSYITGTCFSISIDPMLLSPLYWILDSCASKHVCFHARAFLLLKPIKGVRVTLPDRTSIPVSYNGDIQLNPNLTLTVQFFPDHCVLQETKSLKLIGKGSQFANLYIFKTSSQLDISSTFINHISASTWHNRLGHLSNKCLNTLKHALPCDFSIHEHASCYVCPLAEQRKLSFVSNNNLSALPFDLIHCDLWGPYHISAYSKHRYFFYFSG